LLLSTFVGIAADSDAHARNLNTDARLSVLLRTFLVVLSPWLVMTILLNNHRRSVTMVFLAIAMLITDHLHAQQTIIDIDLRMALGKGACLGPVNEQANSTSKKRKRKLVHIHSRWWL